MKERKKSNKTILLDEKKIQRAIDTGELISMEEIWKHYSKERRKAIENKVIKRILADRVKEARKSKEMSQEAIAEVTGLKREAISRIESGRHNPTIRTLGRIAEAMGKEVRVDFVDVPAEKKV